MLVDRQLHIKQLHALLFHVGNKVPHFRHLLDISKLFCLDNLQMLIDPVLNGFLNLLDLPSYVLLNNFVSLFKLLEHVVFHTGHIYEEWSQFEFFRME